MGIYDRDYSRTETPGVHLGGSRMMVTNIVIINCGIYLLQMMFGDGSSQGQNRLTDFLLLRADLFSSELLTHPWRIFSLVTYGFAHAPDDLRHLLFNMVGLWFLGREVERRYGAKEFLSLYLTALIVGGLGWLAMEQLAARAASAQPWLGPLWSPNRVPQVIGASGAVSAVMLLFVFNFPRRTLLVWGILPMPAWVLGILWIFVDISGAYNSDTSNVAYSAHLAGAAYGGLYFVTQWSLGRWWPQRLGKQGGLFKRKPRLQVHDPDRYEREINDQVDAVLRKIQSHGQESLTAREKRLLEKASRRYQQKHR